MLEQLPKRVISKIDDAVYNNSTIVISGASETGKTTLLKEILELLPENHRVMIKGEFAVPVDTISKQQLVESLRQEPNRIVLDEISGSNILDVYEALLNGQSVLSTVDAPRTNTLTGSTGKVVENLVQRTMFELDELKKRYDGVDIHNLFYDSVDLVIGVERIETEDGIKYNIGSIIEPHDDIPTILYRN